MVDDHGREGRGRVEEAAIHDEDVNVPGLDPCFGEESVECSEHDGLCFETRFFHAEVRRAGGDTSWEVGLVAETGLGGDPPLELEGGVVEGAALLRHLQERFHRDFALLFWLVAREVDKVHGGGARCPVEAEEEEEGGGDGEARERVGVEAEGGVGAEVGEVVDVEAGELEDEGDEEGEDEGEHENGGGVA